MVMPSEVLPKVLIWLMPLNRRFYPFNAFRSLLGIAGDVTAPTYAELCAKKSRPTASSRWV